MKISSGQGKDKLTTLSLDELSDVVGRPFSMYGGGMTL